MTGQGTEHRMTQRLTVLCPQGHRLARMTAAVADALGFGGTTGLQVRPILGGVARFAPGPKLEWQCPPCVRAGVRGASGRHVIRAGRFLEVLAAQYAYGPASVTVTATAEALADAVRERIPHGDPQRERRREAFEALKADAGRAEAPPARVDWSEFTGGAPEFRSPRKGS